ncbi:hypothetical protein [Thalassomonas haliotis]|uniref:Lipoprotein n=1 Tax=Thalassomonas haliotis TaxID=485448 RepID=A0ABY7VAF8_9GAMM|nr:hypothetical protein [Thalassomonas haliotis]WDE10639.1 hypothetical protein H3N35_20625 [Thalassomonas haliotis]
MKKTLLSVISLIMVSGCQSTTSQVEEPSIPEALKALVVAMNKSAPKMVDRETRLDSSYFLENKIIYKFTMINHSVDDLDSEKFLQLTTKKVTNIICTYPNLEYFVNNKVDVAYSYFDKNNKYIAEVIVKTAEC